MVVTLNSPEIDCSTFQNFQIIELETFIQRQWKILCWETVVIHRMVATISKTIGNKKFSYGSWQSLKNVCVNNFFLLFSHEATRWYHTIFNSLELIQNLTFSSTHNIYNPKKFMKLALQFNTVKKIPPSTLSKPVLIHHYPKTIKMFYILFVELFCLIIVKIVVAGYV